VIAGDDERELARWSADFVANGPGRSGDGWAIGRVALVNWPGAGVVVNITTALAMTGRLALAN
jgi:hypothetical protein